MLPFKRARFTQVSALKRFIARTISIAALLAPPAATAQTSTSQRTPPDPTRFQTEIVVTPERGETPRMLVPASTVVLDAPALAALPVVHPAEVVSFLPGFHVAQPLPVLTPPARYW